MKLGLHLIPFVYNKLRIAFTFERKACLCVLEERRKNDYVPA